MIEVIVKFLVTDGKRGFEPASDDHHWLDFSFTKLSVLMHFGTKIKVSVLRVKKIKVSMTKGPAGGGTRSSTLCIEFDFWFTTKELLLCGTSGQWELVQNGSTCGASFIVLLVIRGCRWLGKKPVGRHVWSPVIVHRHTWVSDAAVFNFYWLSDNIIKKR